MKRIIVAAVCALFVFFAKGQNTPPRIDTLYYDSDWKATPHKAFAEYYRIALYPSDPKGKKLFRDYYIDGTLRGKGCFLSIDPNDDANSVFDGTVESFFKNGKTESKRTYVNGKLDGDFIIYADDGLIQKKGTYSNGLQTGLYTEFNDDDSYFQMEFYKGKPLHEHYTYCSPTGVTMKLNVSDHKVMWESPELSERKTIYKDGVRWLVYAKNGITISQTCSISKDYGKWHRIDLIISNDSFEPIEFDPTECISAYALGAYRKPMDLEIWSCDAYLKKVRRSQNWSAFAVGLSEALAAANAGYSSSTSTTTSSYYGSSDYYGQSSSYGSAAAFGSGGYALGSYSGKSSYSGHGSYSGYGSSTTTTWSYDGAAAYQAQVIAQQRMADFSEAQWRERQAKEVGYFKKNTINPGETVSGYVNIQREYGVAFFNTIRIHDAEYRFAWVTTKDPNYSIDENIDYLAVSANKQLDELEVLFEKDVRKYEMDLTEFMTWFSSFDIMDKATLRRVIELEKKYAQRQFTDIDGYLSENKTSKANSTLGNFLAIYESFAIPLPDIEEKIASYEGVLSPKIKRGKYFEDGVYQRKD